MPQYHAAWYGAIKKKKDQGRDLFYCVSAYKAAHCNKGAAYMQYTIM